MKTWIVRFVSLYVFNLVVLVLIGVLLTSVRVGWAAFWAALVLTAATIWLKPLVQRMFRSIAARSAERRTRLGEKLVQGLVVFVVEVVVWIAVVLLSGVDVRGFLWGWIIPPLALLLAFAAYDLIDDRIEARAGALYDRALGGRRGSTDGATTRGTAAPPIPEPAGRPAAAAPRPAASRAEETPRKDRYDGLTEEQRRMLDDLG
ncbi:hypothetical protein F6J84_11810 [Microbacterium caowuchunii]|uniref:hypothetical protein n=1 Tax=Microbacterium caowuchunii TaxID=2614638 RepID=UPI001246E1FF|nr:hypothetical protein [Microbacterium caowuchunii]QEW00715.1 hypothetical protein F6J84_11810 [Microbacterium caowuchunii]